MGPSSYRTIIEMETSQYQEYVANSTRYKYHNDSQDFKTFLEQNFTIFGFQFPTKEEVNIYIYIFTENLNSIYLINNHIRYPCPQYNHLVKKIITSIAQHIRYLCYKMTIQKVRAHTRSKENNMTYSITIDDTTTPLPCIHIAYIIAYRSTKPNMHNNCFYINKSKTQ